VSIDWSGLWASTCGWLSGFGHYCIRVGDSISQLLNVVFFLSQNPNESISGRSYREKHKPFWGKMMLVLDVVFWVFEREHCKKSHEADLTRSAQFLKG
jgi:hypothetical protein